MNAKKNKLSSTIYLQDKKKNTLKTHLYLYKFLNSILS